MSIESRLTFGALQVPLIGVMQSCILIFGLLFLSLSSTRRDLHFYCLPRDAHGIRILAAGDSLIMALRYTASNLLNLKRSYRLSNGAYKLCRHVGILQPTRYIHRASRRGFLRASSDNILVPLFQCKAYRLVRAGANFNNLSALQFVEQPLLASTAPCLTKTALFNALSVNNKSLILSDIIAEKELDLVCLTETWHSQSDGLLFNELTSSGYGLFDSPRISGRGGGIMVLFNQCLKLSQVATPQFCSFECLMLSVTAPVTTVIVIVYRPPKTNNLFYLNLLIWYQCALSLREYLSLGTLTSMLTKKIL